MFVVTVLLSSVVLATAIPSSYNQYDYDDGSSEIENRMDRFWDNFNKKMDAFSRRMENMGKKMEQRHCAYVNGNEYKITIEMPGFNTEDITVTVKEGHLTIRALHNVVGEPTNNYLYIRDLPDFIEGNGSWSYEGGIFKIVFLLKNNGHSLRSLRSRCGITDDNMRDE